MILATISIITLIICLMALTSKKILITIELIFSGITTYFILDWCYEGIYLWESIDDFTQEKIKKMINVKIVFAWIISMLACLALFYKALPYIIKKITRLLFKNIVHKKQHKLTEKKKRLTQMIWLNILRNNFNVDRKIYKVDSKKLDKFDKNLIFYFSVAVHFIICWYFLGINNELYMWVVFSIILLVWLLFLILIPLSRLFDLYIPEE